MDVPATAARGLGPERAAVREPWRRAAFAEALRSVSDHCTECLACVKQCGFLSRHGTPKAMAGRCMPAEGVLTAAYECSLCGLCTAVCPFGVDPAELYLEMRREAVERGAGPLPEHRGLLAYEAKGTSHRFSFYALPAGCATVFFPGCSFAGTRSQAVLELQRRLEQAVPKLGIVLDCCTKPSHDLGRDEHFRAMFGEMRDYLLGQGVREILLACPNCFKVFRRYGEPLQVRSIYELLAEQAEVRTLPSTQTVTVHDPCVMRDEAGVQQSARTLVRRAGLRVREMKSSGTRTLCCGEGGGVGFVDAGLAGSWSRRRQAETNGQRVVTYCAGCAAHLGRHVPTSHVADLLVDPEAALAGRARVARPPFTYWERLRLKGALKRRMNAPVTRERTFRPEVQARPAGRFQAAALLVVLVVAVAAVRGLGLTQHLEVESLRGLIEGSGVLAPLAYMLLYTVAPALFLPGLPITVAGGVLFGPFWGVVYTITSATAGASVAFLIARYLARSWVASKLASPRWRRLDEEVERHGWKVVAFTRLVPLFPFNLLNYAFGLTRIRFLHYVVATFLGMLPACIAFIVFSSSLLDLVRGRISPRAVVGVALVAAVSTLPALLRRWRARQPATGDAAAPAAYDLARSLQLKAGIAAAVVLMVVAAVWGIRRYFYALDAYVYTWEFHYLFWLNNLKAGDLAKFAEYLAPMAPAGQGGVMLALAQGFQAFRLPLSASLLPEAARLAYGSIAGGTAAYLAVLVAALATSAAGWFCLGDVLPLLRRRAGRFVGPDWTVLLPAAALAVPWLPIAAAGLLAGLLRPGLRPGVGALAVGAVVRVAWLLTAPGLFLP